MPFAQGGEINVVFQVREHGERRAQGRDDLRALQGRNVRYLPDDACLVIGHSRNADDAGASRALLAASMPRQLAEKGEKLVDDGSVSVISQDAAFGFDDAVY